MKRVANKNARIYVQNRESFEGSHTFGEWRSTTHSPRDSRYIVCSYGMHWPLFIWENGVWYENEDKASPTTSKHRTQLHPHAETRLLPADAMREIAWQGALKYFIGRGDYPQAA